VEVNSPEGDLQRFQIGGAEATIGRLASNDVQLPRGNISKRHARIVRRDDTILVVDLKSTNGTYVNGRRITAPFVVQECDTIYIGNYRIAVHGDDLEPTIERLLPPYLARDPVEQRLLTEIAQRDDDARIVYADWLEDRGELDRAEFLRIQQEIVGSSPDEPRFEELTSRLRALAASLDLSWRMRVARPPVELCPVAFESRARRSSPCRQIEKPEQSGKLGA